MGKERGRKSGEGNGKEEWGRKGEGRMGKESGRKSGEGKGRKSGEGNGKEEWGRKSGEGNGRRMVRDRFSLRVGCLEIRMMSCVLHDALYLDDV